MHMIHICKPQRNYCKLYRCPSTRDGVSIPDAPLPTGHALFSGSAEGIQNREIPVAGPVIQHSLENDVVLAARGIEQPHKSFFLFVLYDGTNDLYHWSYASATGQQTNVRVLERVGRKRRVRKMGRVGMESRKRGKRVNCTWQYNVQFD